MFKKIVLTVFLCASFSGFLFGFLAEPSLAQNYGLDATANQVGAFKDQVGNEIISNNFIQTRAGKIISFVLSFVGILFLGLMIYSGLLWMTAQGSEAKVTKAKDLLINAVVGLIIVFAAYAITAFIGDFVSNQLLSK